MSAKPCPICQGTGQLVVRFGERLRSLREEHGLSQEELARELNITRTQIANMEHDRSDPTPHTLVFMRQRFSVSVDWLLGISEDRK